MLMIRSYEVMRDFSGCQEAIRGTREGDFDHESRTPDPLKLARMGQRQEILIAPDG